MVSSLQWFLKSADWFAAAEESAVNLPTAVLNREAKESGRSADAIRSKIADAIEVMRGAVSEGLESTATSPSGLTGGRARRLADTGPGLLGARFTDMLARAIATLEVNARMGLIMAAVLFEHFLARIRKMNWIKNAFFRLNAVISVIFLVVTFAEVGGGGFGFYK